MFAFFSKEKVFIFFAKTLFLKYFCVKLIAFVFKKRLQTQK